MNTKNLLIASAVGAVVTAALATIPGVNLLICVVCLPFWGGPLLAAWIYKRQNGTMTMNEAIGVGALTGFFAAVIAFIINLAIGPAASAAMLRLLEQYMPSGGVPLDAVNTGPSVFSLLIGILIDVVFGVIGGLIGGSIFKDKTTTPTSTLTR